MPALLQAPLHATLFFKPCEVPVLLDLFSVRRNVSPDNVGAVRLKVPWGDEHQVVVPNPHPALYLASDPAGAHDAIRAFHYYVVATDELYYSPEQFALLRPDKLFQR